jgi:hypothetical protein
LTPLPFIAIAAIPRTFLEFEKAKAMQAALIAAVDNGGFPPLSPPSSSTSSSSTFSASTLSNGGSRGAPPPNNFQLIRQIQAADLDFADRQLIYGILKAKDKQDLDLDHQLLLTTFKYGDTVRWVVKTSPAAMGGQLRDAKGKLIKSAKNAQDGKDAAVAPKKKGRKPKAAAAIAQVAGQVVDAKQAADAVTIYLYGVIVENPKKSTAVKGSGGGGKKPKQRAMVLRPRVRQLIAHDSYGNPIYHFHTVPLHKLERVEGVQAPPLTPNGPTNNFTTTSTSSSSSSSSSPTMGGPATLNGKRKSPSADSGPSAESSQSSESSDSTAEHARQRQRLQDSSELPFDSSPTLPQPEGVAPPSEPPHPVSAS